jgi:hypothetical protein
MKTEEKNILICNFMEYPGDGNGLYFTPYDESGELVTADNIPYHLSWDYIMPVVEKIEKMDTPDERVFVEIKGGEVFIAVESPRKSGFLFLYQENGYDENDSKLGAVYKAVTAFIQWYNQNK